MEYPSSNSEATDINSLPDELILKIIKLAPSAGRQGENHNFILNVISKISTRFRRISTDASLWRGNISINASQKDARFAIRECINKGTKLLKIRISSGDNMSSGDLMDIYKRCPVLEGLDVLIDLESWPTFPSIAWKSLKVLSLHNTRYMDPIDFWNGDMGRYVPNVVEFTTCTTSDIPIGLEPHRRIGCHDIQDAFLGARGSGGTARTRIRDRRIKRFKRPNYLRQVVHSHGVDISKESTKHGRRKCHVCKIHDTS